MRRYKLLCLQWGFLLLQQFTESVRWRDYAALPRLRLLLTHAGTRSQEGGTRTGNRSAMVRKALQEFIAQREKSAREERERRILAANRERLAREAAALVAEQAKL